MLVWIKYTIFKNTKNKIKIRSKRWDGWLATYIRYAATLRRQNMCQVNEDYAWKAILISSVMSGQWKNRLFQAFKKMPHALCTRTLWVKSYPTNSGEHPRSTGTCARNNAVPCPQWFLTVKTDPEAKALRSTLRSQSRQPCIPALPEDEGVGMTSLSLRSWERSSRRAFPSWKRENGTAKRPSATASGTPCPGVSVGRPDAQNCADICQYTEYTLMLAEREWERSSSGHHRALVRPVSRCFRKPMMSTLTSFSHVWPCLERKYPLPFLPGVLWSLRSCSKVLKIVHNA